MKSLFFAQETRFTDEQSKKAWFELLMAEVITLSCGGYPFSLPKEYKAMQKAAQKVAYNYVEHAPAARAIATLVSWGAVSDAKRKDHLAKGLDALIITAASAVTNYRNHFTIGYAHLPLGIAAENLITDLRKKTDFQTLDAIQHENFAMLSQIAQTFCDGAELNLEAW